MFKKILATVGLAIASHLPLGVLILGKCLLNPVGFWQTLIFYGAGIYLLGGGSNCILDLPGGSPGCNLV